MFKKFNLFGDIVLYCQGKFEFDKCGNLIFCQYCQGEGYIGCVGIFDVLIIDDDFCQVIVVGKLIEEVQVFVVKCGGLGL